MIFTSNSIKNPYAKKSSRTNQDYHKHSASFCKHEHHISSLKCNHYVTVLLESMKTPILHLSSRQLLVNAFQEFITCGINSIENLKPKARQVNILQTCKYQKAKSPRGNGRDRCLLTWPERLHGRQDMMIINLRNGGSDDRTDVLDLVLILSSIHLNPKRSGIRNNPVPEGQ